MGTSSSNPGPKGKRSPQPPFAEKPATPNFPKPAPPEAPREVLPDSLPEPKVVRPPNTSWASPKKAAGKFVKDPSSQNFEKLGGSYVRSSGGSKSASVSSRAGRRVTSAVVGFFSSISNNGLETTLQKFGLKSFAGKNADSIAGEIIEAIAPIGATIEEAIARNALIATMKDFFDELDLENAGTDVLENLDDSQIGTLIELSISNYINERLQTELLNRVERKSLSEAQANRICKQLKKFISGSIQLDMKNFDLMKVDWQGSEGRKIIENFYRQSYDLLGEE
jgi:hypothetical protein